MLPIHHFANTFYTFKSTIFVIVFTDSGNTGHDKITLPFRELQIFVTKGIVFHKIC